MYMRSSLGTSIPSRRYGRPSVPAGSTGSAVPPIASANASAAAVASFAVSGSDHRCHSTRTTPCCPPGPLTS